MTLYSPMISPRQECGRRLLNHLVKLGGPETAIYRLKVEPWASALFDGMRHYVALAVNGPDAAAAADALARSLPEAEFPISGHTVADLSVDGREVIDAHCHLLHLSILTISDG